MKKKYYIIILVIVLLIAIIFVSTSFAYFQIADNSEATTHVYGQTPGGKIIVTDVTSDLHLNIKASDMTLSNTNVIYYADDKENYVTTLDEAIHKIASITLSETDSSYDCVSDVTVTLNIENNSMGKVLEANDLILNLSSSKGEQKIDLSDLKSIGTQKYNLVFSIDKNTVENIKAYVQLNNKETSQIYIAGKELNINIKVDNVVCNPQKTGTEKAQEVLGVATAGISDKVLGGLYRYYGSCDAGVDGGTVTSSSSHKACAGKVDNFVCFGTDNPKENCTDPTSEYMYRIIGIDPTTGDLKLIKNTGIVEGGTNKFQWHHAYSSSDCAGEACEWPNVDLYKRLNGEDTSYSKLFIGKNITKGSNWYSMIRETKWKYGDTKDVSKSADNVYEVENGWTNETNPSKIGLMYIHDYYYSYKEDGTTNCYSQSLECMTSWLHISRNGKSIDSNNELVMSRSGFGPYGGAISWVLGSNGGILTSNLDNNFPVRPVFYLDSTKIKITGNGTVASPFVVSEKKTA